MLSISNLCLIENHTFTDDRGIFSRLFDDRLVQEKIALEFGRAININLSRNPLPGTVRGLHMQKGPNEESKIVTCIKGSILDLVVDMNKSSSTFGVINTFQLTEETNSSIVVPKGCLHAFLTLEANTDVVYVTDNYYAKESEISASPLSDMLIEYWKGYPILNLSDKDRMSTDLSTLLLNF